MSIIPVSVVLTGSGLEQNVSLNKLLIEVLRIELVEALAVGWNGGVSSGAFLRIQHPQLNDISIADRPISGTMLLVDVLNPRTNYTNPKTVAKGQIGNVNGFRISVTNLLGVPVSFTELYLVFNVFCRPADPELRIPNAMLDIPQIKGADPKQTRFLK